MSRLIQQRTTVVLRQLNRFKQIQSDFEVNQTTGRIVRLSNESTASVARVVVRPSSYLRHVFLPEHYPDSVGPNFARYSAWLLIQNSVGSAAYVLSTHALLTSLGVGVAAAAPLAATVNWVLKDGLGSLGMIVYAARGGGAARFDGDAKVTKWRADVLFNVGVLLELLTPLVPTLFLPLASLANVAKGVGGLAAGASKAALHRALARRDNLGDVTAKLYSQGIAAYLIGMGGGIALSHLAATSGAGGAAVLAAFGALTTVHLAASLQALRCVELRSLNEQRLLILAAHYAACGEIATPAHVASCERIVTWRRRSHTAGVCVAPSLADLRADDAALVAERLKSNRYAILTDSRTMLFREDYSVDDVFAAFSEVIGGQSRAPAAEFAAALRNSHELWSPSVELIRIDNVIKKL